jgi:aldehyde:ferredoxin oxidoreductase
MKFIRVNMTKQDITLEEFPSQYENLGGRGLTSKLLVNEVDPKCYALGPANKLVIAPGLLTGTIAPCSGRTSVGAKSPLTGTIKESNVGGIAGQYLAGNGIKAIIIEGKPTEKHSWVLFIQPDGNVRLEQRDELSGLNNYELVNKLKKEYGTNTAILSIGPAGETGASLATVAVTDMEGRPSRHAGRGGMGAVMGSKGIKAIVIARPPKPNLYIEAVNGEDFKQTAVEFAKSLRQSKKSLTNYGTAVLVNVINEVGGLPTRNFSTGYNDQARQFSGEMLYELCSKRGGATGHPCSRGCAIRCSNIFCDEQGHYVTSGLEYETIVLLGSNCGLSNLDEIAQLDRLCDDLGIDTMEMGVTLGVTMEAGLIPFGNFDMMKDAIVSVAQGTLLGKILGQGATIAGKVLGVERVPAVKGQAMSAYDPRALKGTGVTYATSTMGADHTAGNCLPGRGGLDCHQPEGQVQLSMDLQIMSMVCDILGICIFVGPLVENMPVFASLLGGFTGREVTPNSLLEQARDVLKAETSFNTRAGIGTSQNDLPPFFRHEPLPNNNLIFDVDDDELQKFSFQ